MEGCPLSTLLLEHLRERQELIDTFVVDGAALPLLRSWVTKTAPVTRPAAKDHSGLPLPRRPVRKRSEPTPSLPKEQTLTLECVAPQAVQSDAMIAQVIRQACPDLILLEEPPSDARALQLRSAASIVVLSVAEPVLHVKLLGALTRALTVWVAPARLVELSNEQFDAALQGLKAAPPYLLVCSPSVARRVEGSSLPVHALHDLQDLLKRPRLKANVWNSLLQAWAAIRGEPIFTV